MASGLPGTHQTCAKHPFFLLAIHALLFYLLHASGHPGIHQTCAIQFIFAVSYLDNQAFYMASGLPGTHQTCAKHPFFLLAIHAVSYFFCYMRLDIRAFNRHVLPTVYPNQTWVYLLSYYLNESGCDQDSWEGGQRCSVTFSRQLSAIKARLTLIFDHFYMQVLVLITGQKRHKRTFV